MINKIYLYLTRRKTAYQRTFINPYGEEVLQDLARFCRAHESTFNADPRIHAVAEGRREVWLRIQDHLNLTQEQFVQLYNPKGIKND